MLSWLINSEKNDLTDGYIEQNKLFGHTVLQFENNLIMFIYNKIYFLLKSLSLCTILIIFALTHDKLIIDIDKSTFNLIIKILNTNNNERGRDSDIESELLTNSNNSDEDNEYLNDLAVPSDLQFQSPASTRTTLSSPSKSKYSSAASSLASSPTSSQLPNTRDTATTGGDSFDVNENDELVFRKVFLKCKKIYDKLTKNSTFFESTKTETNFNTRLLALDCLINLNTNMKKNLLSNDYFRNELRDSSTIDKILYRMELILCNLVKVNAPKQNNKQDENNAEQVNCFLLGKFKSCVNFLETLTQSNSYTKSSSGKKAIGSTSSKLMAITDIPNSEIQQPVYTVNQNYLIDFGPKNSFLQDLFKR